MSHDRHAKADALRAFANTDALTAQILNDYGSTSPEGHSAVRALRAAIAHAYANGATDDDLRKANPT